MKTNLSYPTLNALEALFLSPVSSWKTLQRTTSFRELIVHYALPFYLITLLSAMTYYLITSKSPLHAIAKEAGGPLLFWLMFTLFLKVTGSAISAGVSHFGIKSKEITGERLLVFALLPAMALAPLYFLGVIGKVLVLTGVFYSIPLIYHGSRYFFKAPAEIEKTVIISVYAFIMIFSVVFFAGYLAIAHFMF